jgi:uncharacterized OB-fold protein
MRRRDLDGGDLVDMLDGLMPPQGREGTAIHRFFDELRRGRLVTTRCRGCGALHWHPRTVCPSCMSRQLAWERLPTTGTVYAFTTVGRRGAPPLTVSIVELEGTSIRLFTRIEASYEDLSIGTRVTMVVRRVGGDGVRYSFVPDTDDGTKSGMMTRKRMNGRRNKNGMSANGKRGKRGMR